MKLTQEQLRHYRAEGYAILPALFDTREVAAMRVELERFKREGLLRNVSTEGDGVTRSQTKQNLQICPITPKSDFFRALPFSPKVVDVVQQILGDPVVHHLDQIFLKPGGSGAGTGWHQDNAYFQINDPTQGVGMWVAMHDAHVANGTMHVLPRAFDRPLNHERDGGSDHHISCTVDESRAVPVAIEAGGALLFNYGVPHCTKGNSTPNERAGLALHFVRQEALHPDDKHGGKPNNRKSILTGPQASGGLREFGCFVAGTWEHHVARLLAS